MASKRFEAAIAGETPGVRGALHRMFPAYTFPIRLDKTNQPPRILVPERLRAWASLRSGAPAVFIGKGDHLELWNRGVYEKSLLEKSSSTATGLEERSKGESLQVLGHHTEHGIDGRLITFLKRPFFGDLSDLTLKTMRSVLREVLVYLNTNGYHHQKNFKTRLRVSQPSPDRIVVVIQDQVAKYQRSNGLPKTPLSLRKIVRSHSGTVTLTEKGNQHTLSFSLPAGPTAGLEERMPGWLKAVTTPEEFAGVLQGAQAARAASQATAALFEPELVPGGSIIEKQINLIGLEESVRSLLIWPEGVPLRLGLLQEKTGLEEAGYRVIQILPKPGSQPLALPPSAVLLAAYQAVASQRDLFVDAAIYRAGLEGVTVPEFFNRFADLSA